LDNQKKTLRKIVLEARELLSINDVTEKSKIIIKNLTSLTEFKRSKLIMCFADFRNEVMTDALIEFCILNDKRVAVPYVTKNDGRNEILASEIYDLSELEMGTYGIREPKFGYLREIRPQELDLVVVPGVAFDLHRNRIGYGAGYYDRFLRKVKENCFKVGIAFELQLMENIPSDKNDVPMDCVITEKRLIFL